MCGIIGIVGDSNVVPGLLRSLKNLEYRGYDSAGIAFSKTGRWESYKSVGNVEALKKTVPSQAQGEIGIGHTRWATHGEPTLNNAHPHLLDQEIALVHNGILQNFQSLKNDLIQRSIAFTSETDTEVALHLFKQFWEETRSPERGALKLLNTLEGDFAIVIACQYFPQGLIGLRKGNSPLALGFSKNGPTSLSSDGIGLQGLAQEIAYTDSNTVVFLEKDQVRVLDAQGHKAPVPPRRPNPFQEVQLGKANFDHFMLKEIFEQPDLVHGRLSSFLKGEIAFPELKQRHIYLSGCGSAFYSGSVGQYYLEKYGKKSVAKELASELFVKAPPLYSPLILISQSGETIDTLKALEHGIQEGVTTYGVVNVPQSSLSRKAHHVLYTQGGVEVGVASTKAFTVQVLTFLLWSLSLAPEASWQEDPSFPKSLEKLPDQMSQVLSKSTSFKDLAGKIAPFRHVFFLGRGITYPVALESALKMKELTYIHSEGFSAGEMKHGPLALMDDQKLVIFLAPFDGCFFKVLSNIEEVHARNPGGILIITDEKGAPHVKKFQKALLLELPFTHEDLSPFLMAMAGQLLAYYTALERGCSIDQPRHLAKSVTVE